MECSSSCVRTAPTPITAISPNTVSAAAIPSPYARPAARPNVSVWRVQRITIGPAEMATASPMAIPRINVSASGIAQITRLPDQDMSGRCRYRSGRADFVIADACPVAENIARRVDTHELLLNVALRFSWRRNQGPDLVVA
ncbi:hypothetical protein BH23CHL5_BH23CHL5_15490 [soil metagenome]